MLRRLIHRLRGRTVPAVWYHRDYRLPVPGLVPRTDLDPRRADLARLALLQLGALEPEAIHTPRRVPLPDLARVHTSEWLQQATERSVLADVLGAPEEDVQVAHVLRTFRLACGGTLEATRWTLTHELPALNLLGGFHHAAPERGSGLCVYNDIAAAIAALRHEGDDRQVVVLDLDAHPPDGLSATLHQDEHVWIGSLSGSDWGAFPGVDETLVAGADDATYLEALEALLSRMPRHALAFVIAGGDVLAEDRFGLVELSVDGARRRDQRVRDALEGKPSVWMPGGGYSNQAWKVLTHTGLTLAGLDRVRLPQGAIETLNQEYERIASTLSPEDLDGPLFTEAEIVEMLGGPARDPRLLGVYTVESIEAALQAYGILEPIRRLGYRDLEVEVHRGTPFDRFKLTGEGEGRRHVLVEAVLGRETLGDETFLLVNWFTLRHPLGKFSPRRPQLPEQEVPGLGLAYEAALLFERVAERLRLDGVLVRPAGFHVAWTSRRAFTFLDPARQGRFLALARDLIDTAGMSVYAVTTALAAGRVTRDGEPYAWEASAMVHRREPRAQDDDAVREALENTHFAVRDA